MNSNENLFTTPDRGLEKFLYDRRIDYIDIVKDETGWTYWQYERNSQLSSALKEYMNEKHQRRQRHKEIRKLVQEKRDQYKKSC